MSNLIVNGQSFALVVLADPSTGLPYSVEGSVTTTATVLDATVTVAGTIAAGAASVAVLNSGAAAGVWNGSPLAAGDGREYPPIQGKTYPAFGYDATGTTFITQRIG
jgi:hypothetical protein